MDGDVQKNLEVFRSSWLCSPESILGSDVRDAGGRRLGTLRNIMIDKHTGVVIYGIVSFDWNSAGDCHALPWRLLQYDVQSIGYVLRVPRLILAGAPGYPGSEVGSWPDAAWCGTVEDYFRSWL
jgi:hypothetical protein